MAATIFWSRHAYRRRAFFIPGSAMLKNALRWLGIAILSVFLVGFGLCGAAGVIGSFQGGLVPFFFGLVGLVIAWGCFAGIVDLWRRRRPPDA
ncbi:MAG: hypothetical protein JF619_21140 [Massilia sp.]|nr:hypothetical protein [Massilia sp.]